MRGFSALKKTYDFSGVIKPFIIIQIKKPFSLCRPKSDIPCFRKIFTPGKWDNMGRVLFGKSQRFFTFPGINNNQFAVKLP